MREKDLNPNNNQSGQEEKKIIYIANAPEKFSELIKEKIIQFFNEQESQKLIEINDLIFGIKDSVFDDEKIRKIMLKNEIKNKQELEDYFYPLSVLGFFTLLKEKKIELSGDARHFVETILSIKNNKPKKIEKNRVFLKIKDKSIININQRETLDNDLKEENNQTIEKSEEFTDEEIENIIIDILKENNNSLTKEELFLELAVIDKEKFSQIIKQMKEKGVINYSIGNWKKTSIFLEKSKEIKDGELEEDKEIAYEEIEERKQQEEIGREEEIKDKERLELSVDEKKDKEEEKEDLKYGEEKLDPVQEAVIEIFNSSWTKEKELITLNRLFSILKSWDYSGRIGLQRFPKGAEDPKFITLVFKIPEIKIDNKGRITYDKNN